MNNTIAEIVKNWRGKGETLESLPIHGLINALDEEKCRVAQREDNHHPLIPFLISKTLDEKMIDLVSHVDKYPLKEGLGTLYQIYMAFRPKSFFNINRLFVATKTSRGYNLGIGYHPETGDWDHGHYGFKSVEAYEEYLNDEYGVMMPLLTTPGKSNEIPEIPRERIVNLYDCDTDFLVRTNASTELIEEALEYKQKMLEEDDPAFRSDFEEMQEYVKNKGYVFEQIGYANEIESYSW